MPRLRFAALLLVAAACGPSIRTPRVCAAREDCAADALCRAGACVASAAPTAQVAAPADEGLRSHRVLAFDSSASFDSDAEDHIAAWRWTVRADAPCAPEVLDDSGPALEVRLECGGVLEVELVVVDSTGVESAPATRRVSVLPEEDPLIVTPGPDVERGHRCEGAPSKCTPVDDAGATTIALHVDAGSASGGAVRYAWTCAPPSGLADVRLSLAGAATPDATLAIETDGTRIAGEYRCTVDATDARGVTNRGVQIVRISNRPPVVTFQQPPPEELAVPHAYDAAAQVYRASRSSPVVLDVTDPDGDRVLRANDDADLGWFALHEGDGDAAFAVVARQAPVGDFVITVGAGAPQHLIGEGVSRRLEYRVADVNGDRTVVAWNVVVTNRAPRALAWPDVTVPHAFDGAARAYWATAQLGAFVDDDGDPLAPVTTTDPLCPELALDPATWTAYVACAAPYLGTESLAGFAKVRDLAVTVKDAWTESPAQPVRITITNRAPVVNVARIEVPTAEVKGNCCESDPEFPSMCNAWRMTNLGGSTVMPVPVSDPDGDPVTVSTSGGTMSPPVTSCSPWSCEPVTFSLPAAASYTCGSAYPNRSVEVSVSDGVAAATATIQVAGVRDR